MSKLNVLQCIVHGGFGMYFVGFAVLGGVIYFFLSKEKTKEKVRLGIALVALLVYSVCEFIATVICQGHISAIFADFLGMLGLGVACGLLLCGLGMRLICRRNG